LTARIFYESMSKKAPTFREERMSECKRLKV